MNEHLPLTEATFFILLSLAPGGKHGYAIMQDVASLSSGRITLGTGTLYGALKRLLEQGWIARADDDDSDDEGRPRKVYTLTDTGRRILQAETDRLQQVAQVARLRLKGDTI
ncbi:MAG: PadR family transcriptional regulator [Anaerolineae bacterium]|nr:PadR family transcriptional regulator [Anaerolineae bacterium]